MDQEEIVMQKQFYDAIATAASSVFFVLILTLGPLGIVNIFCQDRRSGELEPGARVNFTFECSKGEVCGFNATFGPKHQREQGEAECQKFKLMSWVDGEWFNTASGYFKYVEDSSGKEVLQCVAYTGYQGGKLGSKNRTFQIEVSNGNIWKGLYELERVASK